MHMDTNRRTKNPEEKRVENDRDIKSAIHGKILDDLKSDEVFKIQNLIGSFIDLKADHLYNQSPRFRVKTWADINNVAVMKLFIVGQPYEIGNALGHFITKKMSVVLIQRLLPDVIFFDSCKSSNGILKERVGAMDEVQIHQLIERVGELILNGKNPDKFKAKLFPIELIISSRSALCAKRTNDQSNEEEVCCAFIEALIGKGYFSAEDLQELLIDPYDSKGHTVVGVAIEGHEPAGTAAIDTVVVDIAAPPLLLERKSVEIGDILPLLLEAEREGKDLKAILSSYMGQKTPIHLQTGWNAPEKGTLPDKFLYSSHYSGEIWSFPAKVITPELDVERKKAMGASYKDDKSLFQLQTGFNRATSGTIPDKCHHSGIFGLFPGIFKEVLAVSEVEKVLHSENKLIEGEEWGTPCKNFFLQDEIISFNKLFNKEKMIVDEISISNILNIFEMNTNGRWIRINDITLLRILLVGDKYQLQCYIRREFNELMALQLLKLLAPRMLLNKEYHSWTWVRLLSLCVYSDTYEEGRSTLITVIGTLINRAKVDSFPLNIARNIRKISLTDYKAGYLCTRHMSLSYIEEWVNRRKYLSEDELFDHAELILSEFSQLYRLSPALPVVPEPEKVLADGDIKVALAVRKERTVETSEDIYHMHISEGEEVLKMLESGRLIDRSLTLYQNFQDYKNELTVTPAVEESQEEHGREVPNGYELATVVGMLPEEIAPPIYGFGGVTEDAVKGLAKRGSYLRFKAKKVAPKQVRNSDIYNIAMMQHVSVGKYDDDVSSMSLGDDKSGPKATISIVVPKLKKFMRWAARRKLSKYSILVAIISLKLVNDGTSDKDLDYHSWEDQPQANVVFKMMNIAISAIYNSRRETWKRRKRK